MHLQRSVEDVKRGLFGLGALVQQQLELALIAVKQRDTKTAARVIAGDDFVDERELALDEQVMGLLAVHQPQGEDLRYLLGILKLTTELERIGDLAVDIARQAPRMAVADEDIPPLPHQLDAFAGQIHRQLRMAQDALVYRDSELADHLLAEQDETQQLYHEIRMEAREAMARGRWLAQSQLSMIEIAAALNRVRAHSANVAEYVLWLVRGELVRHGSRRVIQRTLQHDLSRSAQ